MGIATDIADDWHAALAALAWQVEAGVDEVISDAPVNRYELAAEAPKLAKPAPQTNAPRQDLAAPPTLAVDAVAAAKAVAARATTLEELRSALAGFDLCELKRGARNTVFADGNPAARVLVLGEAPGAEEDREGRPFVGRAGQLLDKMFAAVGLSRTSPAPETALYITNVMPWRPPGNRDPEPAEIAMMLPFVERHIALVDPQVIVVMGNTPLFALTGGKGILRARGTWTTALGKPLLPMAHPAYLLRNPAMKREAWADLLSLQARLR
ncbi:uracil-DNA glycosylase [Tabrizicola aquatica]|uniref:uracil-DNA glycosylase n=1 Tax=Tabrizicola aquatica TaxID=909926 RepID=UPI000CD230F1|nr:uracil-DNA glycosylase [Tabrizicola aquatica]